MASNYFRQNLYATEGTDALSYLHNRGVSDSMIEEFGLGYALDHFEDMRNYMLKQGFSDQNLSTIDLIKPKQGKVAEFFDSFRDRVMFPIQNNLGHTIAFGARTLSGADPKYLNSAEHPLYHKSDVIYNLHRAKTHIKKQDFTIVVEGYMDAIMMYQEGFHNVVATLGTAFTPKHLQKLKRLSNKIVFAFDSDNAGQAAIKEAGMMALAQDMDVYVLTLPGAKDPAELLLEENGKESLEQSIEAKKALIDYFIDTRRDFYDLTEVLDRKNYAIEIISLIQTSTNALVREAYIQKLSSITHLSGDNLMYILANIDKEKAAKQDRQVKKAASQKASNSVKLSVEDYLIGMLINTQKFIEQIPSDMQLSSPVKTKLLHDLLAVIQAGEFNSSQFINQQDNDRIKTYLGFVSLYIEDTLDEKSESWVKNEIDALLRKIQQKTTKNSTDLLKKQIQEKESRGEMDEEYFTLLKQLQDGLTR
ncbi:MAG: toprim domain-containing protein [Patescibacteria group bacterium]|nr:toprim domain-containing protein [Patescibacteria group bacterium]